MGGTAGFAGRGGASALGTPRGVAGGGVPGGAIGTATPTGTSYNRPPSTPGGVAPLFTPRASAYGAGSAPTDQRPSTTGTGTRPPAVPSRPSTSQGTNAVTPRPPGSARTANQRVNDVRRRNFTPTEPGSVPVAPLSARRYGESPGTSVGGGPLGVPGGPATAWAPRVGGPGGRTPDLELQGNNASSAHPSGSQSARGSSGGPQLSARESAREEAMKTCRGAFNVSCTSSKHPRQIMQEIQRALSVHRVSFKQASAYCVKCQKQAVRFEMEMSHLDNLESIYVVRFKRVAGELWNYKDMCAKILAEMKV